MIHCPNGTSLDQGSIQFWLYILIRSLINFPVAVFIFMAGWFVNRQKVFKDYKAYMICWELRLLIPYLLWSTVYFLISYVRGEAITPLTVVKRLLIGKSAGPFYYIIVMLQLTLMTYWLCKIHDNIKKKALVYVMPPVMLAIIYYMAISKDSIPWWCDTLFPVWIGFYFLGIQVQKGDKKIESLLTRIGSLPFVILFFIVNLLESIILVRNGIPFTLSVSQNRVGGFLFALSLIGLFYRYRSSQINSRIMIRIGNNSYGIFYIHCFFIMIINGVLSRIIASELWVPRFIIAFILTLVCSEIVINLMRGIAKKLNIEPCLKFIGF